MKQMKDYVKRIEMEQAKMMTQIEALRIKAFKAFIKEMANKMSLIEAIVAKVATSTDLTRVENDDWYHQYIRVDFSSLIDTKDKYQKEMLGQLLQGDYSVYADFENDTVTDCIGPCIIVNHEGDVLDQDSGKWIISRKDYETEEERNSLIEAHMEKSEYFPSVVLADYYGNGRYIQTQSAEQLEKNKALIAAQDAEKSSEAAPNE